MLLSKREGALVLACLVFVGNGWRVQRSMETSVSKWSNRFSKLSLSLDDLQRGSHVRMATDVLVADPKVDTLQGIKVKLPPVVDDKVWHQAFEGLVTHNAFVSDGWSQRPFKLNGQWSFADGAYTMDRVQDDVTLLPPQFVSGPIKFNNGVYNKPMDPGFTYEDVRQRMQFGTMVMLNAGFMVPSLAHISLAMLEATSLPIWTNVYITRPGFTSSTPLHTDRQDVLLVQTSGRKRWRVYTPPPPAEAPFSDPFARGKGEDLIEGSPDRLLVDTVMEPGQVLYIPAAFPHETDTLEANAQGGFTRLDGAIPEESDEDPSIHLTIGVDTHLWGITWAKMRELALRRAKLPATLASGLPVNTLPPERWSLLHAPLPVGFAAAQLHAAEADEANAARTDSVERLAAELASRLVRAEPERWADASAVAAQLPLKDAAAVMLSHYRRVLDVQRGMYQRALKGPVRQDVVFGDMDELDEASESLEAWAEGKSIAAAAPSKAGFGVSKTGFGAAKKSAGKSGAKSKSKAKKRKR